MAGSASTGVLRDCGDVLLDIAHAPSLTDATARRNTPARHVRGAYACIKGLHRWDCGVACGLVAQTSSAGWVTDGVNVPSGFFLAADALSAL